MIAGGANQFVKDARASWVGEQTARVHGGLLFSRSSTKLWHESATDVAGCRHVGLLQQYSQHDERLPGRPVVLEPGSDKMQLQEAVALMAKHANQDAWYIRVTGDLTEMRMCLSPRR